MTAVTIAAMAIMLALAVPYLTRVIRGPSVFDRVAAVNALGTMVPVLIVLTGVLYGRVDMFVDIAIGLFLLNLVTTLLIAKWAQGRRL